MLDIFLPIDAVGIIALSAIIVPSIYKFFHALVAEPKS